MAKFTIIVLVTMYEYMKFDCGVYVEVSSSDGIVHSQQALLSHAH
jgi:hypothetical protein